MLSAIGSASFVKHPQESSFADTNQYSRDFLKCTVHLNVIQTVLLSHNHHSHSLTAVSLKASSNLERKSSDLMPFAFNGSTPSITLESLSTR